MTERKNKTAELINIDESDDVDCIDTEELEQKSKEELLDMSKPVREVRGKDIKKMFESRNVELALDNDRLYDPIFDMYVDEYEDFTGETISN